PQVTGPFHSKICQYILHLHNLIRKYDTHYVEQIELGCPREKLSQMKEEIPKFGLVFSFLARYYHVIVSVNYLSIIKNSRLILQGKKLGQFIKKCEQHEEQNLLFTHTLVMTWKISLKWDGFYVILRISYNKPEFNISLWEYSIQHDLLLNNSIVIYEGKEKEYDNLFVEHIVCRLKAKNYSLIYVRIMEVKLYTTIIKHITVASTIQNRNVSMKNFGSNKVHLRVFVRYNHPKLHTISINISTMFFPFASIVSISVGVGCEFARAEVIVIWSSVIFLIFIKIYIAQELQYYGNYVKKICLTLNKHTHIIHKYRYSAGTNGAYGFEEILEKERKDMHSIMNQIFLDEAT
ncbi:hypothetical protein ACJX0J_006735, partial [Zea mays]